MITIKELFTFNKEDNDWYIDLPEYINSGGSKEDLQMVAGADYFLDELSKGESQVILKISDKEFTDAEQLHLKELGRLEGVECGTGAWYLLKKYGDLDLPIAHSMWLCDVAKFIFHDFPWTIYFKVEKS